MPDATIPQTEFAARRKKLNTTLKNSVGLIFAGKADPSLHHPYRPHPHFEYLTGITDEPGAVLLLDPAHPAEARREMLFLRPLNPEVEKWDGYRLEVGQALREKTGVKAILRLTHFARALNEAAKRSRSLACLHPLAQYDQPVSPDLAMFRKVAERIPGTEIVDRTESIAKLRAVKSKNEIAVIQQAVNITQVAFDAALKSLKPGMNEFDLQETIEHAYRTNGSRGPAFSSICGAGVNSTVLHYGANDQPIEKGDLICIDTGASFGSYGADITRTVPASGTFTKRQREIYEIVLKAEMAAIKLAKPGVRFGELDKLARAVITRAGFGDAFIHSIGHHLGVETHDVTPDEPLRVGAVITIEPGIYLPDEKIGVRIEDDIVITRDGSRNLSAKIPKSVAAIEKAMAG